MHAALGSLQAVTSRAAESVTSKTSLDILSPCMRETMTGLDRPALVLSEIPSAGTRRAAASCARATEPGTVKPRLNSRRNERPATGFICPMAAASSCASPA